VNSQEFYRAVILLVLSILIWGCKGGAPVEVHAEGYDPFLLGPIQIADLEKPPYSDWYTESYKAYEPNTEVMERLGKHVDGTEYVLFLGTWCEDSQREVPGMIKILDRLGVSRKRLELIGVDEREEQYNKSPGGETEAFKVDLVPTLIVRKEGSELGRIVELPWGTLEEDLLEIFEKK